MHATNPNSPMCRDCPTAPHDTADRNLRDLPDEAFLSMMHGFSERDEEPDDAFLAEMDRRNTEWQNETARLSAETARIWAAIDARRLAVLARWKPTTRPS